MRFRLCEIARRGGLALLLLALPAAARAAGGAVGQPGAAYKACMARANSTRDMQDCQRAGLLTAESRLRAAFAKAVAVLPPDQQAKLKNAEARWTVFRQSDCEVFYGSQTGTLASVQGGQCMIDRTESRIKQLGDFHTSN